MGNLSTKVSELTDDLKHSWYFRFWMLFWVICAIFAFSALILYGARSSEDEAEKGWRLWITEEKSITLPPYQFRISLSEKGNIINSASCAWTDALLVPSGPCNTVESTSVCVEFDPTGFSVDAKSNFLNCVINMTVPNGNDNLLAFKIAAGEHFDENDVWTYLAANNRAYLNLRLTRVKSGGSFKKFWSTQVSYTTSTAVPTQYVVILQMEHFFVFNYEKTDWYTGWMAAADIGGFAFFMYILHWIVMTFMNIFMENNSKFLNAAGNGPQRAQYNTL